MLRGLMVVYVGALVSALLAAAYPTDNPDATYQTITTSSYPKLCWIRK